MNSESRTEMRKATTGALLLASLSFMGLLLAAVHFNNAQETPAPSSRVHAAQPHQK